MTTTTLYFQAAPYAGRYAVWRCEVYQPKGIAGRIEKTCATIKEANELANKLNLLTKK